MRVSRAADESALHHLHTKQPDQEDPDHNDSVGNFGPDLVQTACKPAESYRFLTEPIAGNTADPRSRARGFGPILDLRWTFWTSMGTPLDFPWTPPA